MHASKHKHVALARLADTGLAAPCEPSRGEQPVRLAGGCCWFVLREEYCWLVAGGWFVVREKYCWLVADKPSEQGRNLNQTPPNLCTASVVSLFS
jgi:hypothetical protein